jgi:hypothetical protein
LPLPGCADLLLLRLLLLLLHFVCVPYQLQTSWM